MTQLVRSSLVEKLDQIEIKEEEEKEKRERDRHTTPKRAPGTVTGIIPLDQRPPVDLTPEAPADRLAPIFERHATRLMEVVDSPVDLAQRQQEALTAIKRLAPLTYGSDDKIRERLESLIFEKASLDEQAHEQAAAPAARQVPAPAPAQGTTDSALASLAKLAQLMQRSQQQPDDPLVGKTLDNARVRSRTVVQDED